MKRVLLLLDGTHNANRAFSEVAKLCETGDGVIALAVVDQPEPEIIGMQPPSEEPNTSTAGTGSFGPSIGDDVPVLETSDDVRARVSGEVLGELNPYTNALQQRGIDAFARVIVRDVPGEAIVEWARDEQPTHVAVLATSFERLNESLSEGDETDVLNGRLAPVEILPA
jgi:nucleotide-binding universal stress UspA family protein